MQSEGVNKLGEISDADDSSYQEEEEEDEISSSESFDEEHEEHEDKEMSYPEISQEPVVLPQDSVQVVITMSPSEPAQQPQTPPITPEHPPSSRKRTLPTDEEETDPPPSPTVKTRLFKPENDDTIALLRPENGNLAAEDDNLEQPSKRRRLDNTREGDSKWVGMAKSVGKYTVAGVVGGIVMFVGLVWSAK